MEQKKKLSFVSLLIAVFTSMVGAGIYFKLPGILAAVKGNINAVLLAWVIGGLIVLSIGLIFAEVFSNEETAKEGFIGLGENVFGKRFAFAITWSFYIFYMTIICGLISHMAISFLFIALNVTPSFSASIIEVVCAIALLGAFFVLNFVSLEFTKISNLLLTSLKAVILIVVIVSGIAFNGNFTNVSHAFALSSTSGNPFLLSVGAIPMIMFSLEGWLFPTALAADAKDPKIQWPIAFISGIIIAVVVYLLFSIASINFVELSKWNDISQKVANITDVLSKAFHNPFFGKVLWYILALSLFGSLNAFTQATGRMACELAENKFFPEVFAKRNSGDLPFNAAMLGYGLSVLWIFIGFVLVILLPAIFGETGTNTVNFNTQDFTAGLDTISNWVVVLFFVYYFFAVLGYAFKRSETLNEKSFKLPAILFYLLVILALFGSAYVVGTQLYSAYVAGGLLSIGIFAVLYYSGFYLFGLFNKQR